MDTHKSHRRTLTHQQAYLFNPITLIGHRLQEPGSLQRISSRRRKRPRPTRQDTTESEDDGGRSQQTPRWNPRLSPHRGHSRTILEVIVSGGRERPPETRV